MKMVQLEKSQKDIEEIIDVCTMQRGSTQDPKEYIEEITEKLLSLGASEKAIIKVLAYNIWPRSPKEIKEELLKSESLRDFRNNVNNNITKLKNNKPNNKSPKAI